MYDLERLKKEFYEACESQGMTTKIPVLINPRLTRTLGRVTYSRDYFTNISTPTKVEFSKELLETSSDQSIRDVLLHESAHAIVTSLTGERHGHDSVFKDMCHKLGTNNDGTTTDVERTQDLRSKYVLTCGECNKQYGYSRMCSTVKNYKLCKCKCGGKLSLTQNW